MARDSQEWTPETELDQDDWKQIFTEHASPDRPPVLPEHPSRSRRRTGT